MAEGNSSAERYVCEFVGTYLLVLTVVCNVSNGSAYAALSIACVLMVMIYAVGSISGAHFNPAVTVAVTLSDAMEGGWVQAIIYMIFQITGGICGAITGFSMYNSSFTVKPGVNKAASGPHGEVQFGVEQALLSEFLWTFMLCFVVLNVACAKATSGNQYYGLAIGFVIVSGAYSVGPISGGCLNPAVALGIDVGSLINPKAPCAWNSGLYLLVELVAGAVAALLFRVVRPDQFGGNAQDIMRKFVSEFLGTFFLVLSVGLNVLAGNSMAAFSIASTLMCMIYALGDVSGAHFNPAVTFAILLSGRDKTNPMEAFVYTVVQLLAGLTAGLIYVAVYGSSFALKPEKSTYSQIVPAELIFTAVLCFVVLNVATLRSAPNQFFGFAIGMCVTVGGFAIGSISGGSLNPAVSIGLDTMHAVVTNQEWINGLQYSAIEYLGAMVACGIFYMIRKNDEYKPVY